MRRTTITCLILAALMSYFAAVAPAAESLWDCLPAETIVAMRMPDNGAFLDALRARTKLGKTVLTRERYDRCLEILRQADQQQWDQMIEDLEPLGLTPAELPDLFKGEAAIALVAEPREGREPLFVAMGWFSPGQERAGRLLDAIAEGIEKNADDEHAVKRTDLELAGHKVMHLTVPHVEDPDMDMGFKVEMGPDGNPVVVQEEDEPDDNIPLPMTDQIHILITPAGDKLVVAVTFPQSSGLVASMLDAGGEVDFDKLTGIEQATGIFARLLAARNGEGDTGAFTRKAMATPGAAEAMPKGDTAIEMIADFRKLFALLESYDQAQQVMQMLKTLGLDGFGVAAYRQSLDGNLWRSGMFLEAPAPREGLMAMLDQEPLAPEPPAWVPADIVGYGQFSFDLGKAYQLIKDTIIATFGEAAAMNFQMVEQQVVAFTQADPATLLGSIGNKHVVLSFMPTSRKMAQGDIEMEMPVSRSAFVWEVDQEDPWKMVLAMAGGFLAQQPGTVPVDEQGFVGWRMENEVMEGALLVGKGHLVLGMGPDVIEPVLAALSNPPQAEAAFRTSTIIKQARQLQDFGPGVMFQVVDAGRYFEKFLPMMMDMITSMVNQAQLGDDAAQVLEAMKELMPTEQELAGTFGVSAGDMRITEHGISGGGVLRLPPPDGNDQ